MKKTAALATSTEFNSKNFDEQLIPPAGAEEEFLSIYPLRPLDKWTNSVLKRSFDFVASTCLLLLLFSWLLPIIALLIRLDSKGPVFFLQKRTKRKGELFTCIKFRTMMANEEADTLPAFGDDPRITRLGKILRSHHIDELPQLLNVWWGDMALIGPRPHMITDNERYESVIPVYGQRHQVKPGITGLAQVKGLVGAAENAGHMWERVSQDIYYIHNWSPMLDAHIIYRTLSKMIR